MGTLYLWSSAIAKFVWWLTGIIGVVLDEGKLFASVGVWLIAVLGHINWRPCWVSFVCISWCRFAGNPCVALAMILQEIMAVKVTYKTLDITSNDEFGAVSGEF